MRRRRGHHRRPCLRAARTGRRTALSGTRGACCPSDRNGRLIPRAFPSGRAGWQSALRFRRPPGGWTDVAAGRPTVLLRSTVGSIPPPLSGATDAASKRKSMSKSMSKSTDPTRCKLRLLLLIVLLIFTFFPKMKWRLKARLKVRARARYPNCPHS